MIKFSIEPTDKDPFELMISRKDGSIRYNLWLPANFIENPSCCQKCYEGKTFNHCSLLDALLPVLVYFSELNSFESVKITYEEGHHKATFLEPAQSACFVVTLYAMCYSKCDFFCRFRPFLKLYRIHITSEIFMHFVLTTALVRRQLEFDGISPKIDIFTEVKKFMNEVNQRMVYILKNTKLFSKKDAAINSLTTIFSLSLLSSEYLKDYYQELIEIIGNLPRIDTNQKIAK